MLKKLTDVETDDEMSFTKIGGFNDAPPNMKEISQEDFAQSVFFTYGPAFIEHRQITPINLPTGIKSERYLQIAMFWFHDNTGIGMSGDYWSKTVRYFSFAICDHVFDVTDIGRCLHLYTCKKCGYTQEVDSSG